MSLPTIPRALWYAIIIDPSLKYHIRFHNFITYFITKILKYQKVFGHCWDGSKWNIHLNGERVCLLSPSSNQGTIGKIKIHIFYAGEFHPDFYFYFEWLYFTIVPSPILCPNKPTYVLKIQTKIWYQSVKSSWIECFDLYWVWLLFLISWVRLFEALAVTNLLFIVANISKSHINRILWSRTKPGVCELFINFQSWISCYFTIGNLLISRTAKYSNWKCIYLNF